MSAPSIPKLNSLRTGRGGARGGLLGRSTTKADKDAIVRSTDNDASSSRISAVDAGYLDDPFATYLADENWQRRLPLMNRGTYLRTAGIDRIVDTFLSSTSGSKQIVSLGAGSDTRYFRLKREKKHKNFTYHEIDFPENNSVKSARLRTPQCVSKVKELCDVDLSAAQISGSDLSIEEYHTHALDLRQLPDKLSWLSPDVPTLLVSECCLIYLSPDDADQVITYFTSRIPSTSMAIVIYEPFRPNDPFGRTMIRNLTTRGIVLQTIEKYSDLAQQRERLSRQNLAAEAVDMDFIWRRWIDQAEKERVDKLEWMDEVEEFVLLAKHYCIVWGWRNYQDDSMWTILPAA